MDLRNWEYIAETSQPLVGATVLVRDATLTHPNGNTVLASTTTDSNGMWAVTGLADTAKDVEVIWGASSQYHRWYKGMTRHNLGKVVFTETITVNGLATFTGGASFSGGTTFATLPTVTSLSKAQAHLQGGAQALTNSVWNTIQMDTEDEDILGEYNPATYTFTPQANGTYFVSAGVTVGGTTVAQRTIMSLWNGTTNAVALMCDAGVILAQGTVLVPLTAGVGYVLRVFPVYAGGNVQTGVSATYIQYMRVR
jgi:hypothetical protein